MTIPKAPAIFTHDEYMRRIDAVKAEMERREVSAVLITTPANITYLTGYSAKSAYVPQGVIIDLSRKQPFFFTRIMDAPAAKHQVFMSNDHVLGYSDSLIANPEKDGYDIAIDVLADYGQTSGSIGLETSYLPAATVQKFHSRLPDAKIVDFTNAVTWIRGVKSEAEIALMREAAANSDAGVERAREVIRPGIREADAAAEILAALTRGVNGKPSTDISSFFMCATPRTGTCHIRWTEDVFREGSQVNLEFSGNRHQYASPIMRTICIGRPPERLQELHEAEVAGLEAALATARTGATCHDVATAFHKEMNARGWKKESRCGYAVGIDWLEPTASLKEGDMTVLKPNMTFHLMLGNWLDDEFGYVISETFRVTDHGGEVFTKIPREILVV